MASKRLQAELQDRWWLLTQVPDIERNIISDTCCPELMEIHERVEYLAARMVGNAVWQDEMGSLEDLINDTMIEVRARILAWALEIETARASKREVAA